MRRRRCASLEESVADCRSLLKNETGWASLCGFTMADKYTVTLKRSPKSSLTNIYKFFKSLIVPNWLRLSLYQRPSGLPRSRSSHSKFTPTMRIWIVCWATVRNGVHSATNGKRANLVLSHSSVRRAQTVRCVRWSSRPFFELERNSAQSESDALDALRYATDRRRVRKLCAGHSYVMRRRWFPDETWPGHPCLPVQSVDGGHSYV